MSSGTATPPTLEPQYANGKELARAILHETLRAIDVRTAMSGKIRMEGNTLIAGDVSLRLRRPPHVIAFGKAALRMSEVLAEILEGKIERGVVVAPKEPVKKMPRFRFFTGGHPYPDEGSLEGAEAALEMVRGLSRDDTVIFLVSGGGSALLEKPLDPAVSLADLVEFNRLLVNCGMPIEQMNVLRKHLSAVKGGRLALAAYPAQQLTLYISDVPAAYPSMVASGPTMPDDSTTDQCYALANDYKLLGQFPASIRKHFENRTLEETPKPADERFRGSRYFCLLSNYDAVGAAKGVAEKMGFVCKVEETERNADFREVARADYAALDEFARSHEGQAVCFAGGGEVICPVTGKGMGGRNQAYVLYAAQLIENQKRVVMSAGTDGRDGNSPACGSLADGQTLARARTHGLDPDRYLAESDSYYFFRTLSDTLDTGFVDNNVRDIRVWLDFGC